MLILAILAHQPFSVLLPPAKKGEEEALVEDRRYVFVLGCIVRVNERGWVRGAAAKYQDFLCLRKHGQSLRHGEGGNVGI